MNATSLYTAVCRAVLLANPSDASSWSDIALLLPYLRRNLSCCACGLLAREPVTAPSCRHVYCRECEIGGKEPILKITCKRCKDRRHLVADEHARLLVDCYRAVCDVVNASTSSTTPTNGGRGVLALLIAETISDVPLASYAVLPKTNSPSHDVQKDVERRRQEVVNELAEDQEAMPGIVAQLSAGLARKGGAAAAASTSGNLSHVSKGRIAKEKKNSTKAANKRNSKKAK